MKKAKKIQTIAARFRFALRKYLRVTSIDGFLYLKVYEYSKLKLLFWLTVCTSCLIFSLYLVYLQIVEYTTNVTNNPITTTAFPVWKFPFPALTVCNYNIVYKNRVKKFANILEAKGFQSGDIKQFFENFGILIFCNDCDYAKMNLNFSLYAEMYKELRNNGYDTNRLMEEVAHPCKSMLKKCVWRSKRYECTDLFSVARATNGICCSFNYYGTVDVQEKYSPSEFLRYSGGVGESSGLIVEVDIEEDQFMSTIKPTAAVEVVIHHSYGYPDYAYLSYTLWAGDSMTLGIHPSVILGNEEIRTVPPIKRGCQFEDENNMVSTKYYDYQTCLNECRAVYILNVCKCVPFFVPKLEGPTCTLADYPCLQINEVPFSNLILKSTVTEDNVQIIKERINETSACDCLFNCNLIKYNAHLTKTSFKKTSNNSLAEIKVFYNSICCTKRERVLTMTWDMLLASLGGIFGLCLGASICSVIELLYHITKFLLFK